MIDTGLFCIYTFILFNIDTLTAMRTTFGIQTKNF
nr:MAG TPA: hypothetical protein [Caudoviricetes sp.]